jgi:hypothetical protein
MKRAIVLSLVMIFSMGVMVPFVTDWSEASKPTVQKKRKKLKKYSRAWWRQYRAKKRHAQAIAARRRAFENRREAMAQNNPANGGEQTVAGRNKRKATEKFAQPLPVLGKDAPGMWSGQTAAGGSDMQFRVADQNGQQIGSASLSFVSAAMPSNEADMTEKARKQMLGGISVSALRRTVIDKMIKQHGWVVNDYQRIVDGKKVFVVVAQSSNAGVVQSRQFYFTEVDGRIYSLATNAPNDYSEKVAADSEKVLSAMSRNNRPVQTAATDPNK